MSDSTIRSICIFCGARVGLNPAYKLAATKIAEIISEKSIKIIYGGGHTGLMGQIADSALANHGTVIGVIPESLKQLELAHEGVTELHTVQTMHERKALMADLADAFIALPGGFGTLDELCEIITWMQLKIHAKPIGILNVEGFFDSFLQFVDFAVQQKLISVEHRQQLIVEQDPNLLLEKMFLSQKLSS